MPKKPKKTGANLSPEPKPMLPVGKAASKAAATGPQEPGENVPLSQDAATIFEALQTVVGDVKAGAVTTDEIPIFDAFRQGLDKASDALKEAMRPAAIEAAKGAEGTYRCETGQITYTFIPGKETVEYTEETVAYLERIGSLEEAVNLTATLKPGVDVKSMSEDDLKVLQRFFIIEHEVAQDKLAALFTLGKADPAEVEKTVVRTPGKATERVTITPKPEIKKAFTL